MAYLVVLVDLHVWVIDPALELLLAVPSQVKDRKQTSLTEYVNVQVLHACLLQKGNLKSIHAAKVIKDPDF